MTNPVHEFALLDTPMTKEAGLRDFLSSPQFKSTATKAAITAAIPFATLAGFEGYDAIKGAIQKSRGFKKMVSATPELKDVPADNLKLMYNSVYSASPTVARDPLAAGYVVKRMATYGGIDTKTITELAGAEQRMSGQMSPFRQQMINNMTNAMADSVMSPIDVARMRESEASRRLKEEELGQLDTKLKLMQAGQGLKEEEFKHRKGVDQQGIEQRRTEFTHRQDVDRENIRLGRRNANTQEQHNLATEAIGRGQLGTSRVQNRLSREKLDLDRERALAEADRWEMDRGIGPGEADAYLQGQREHRKSDIAEVTDRMKHYGAVPGHAVGGYGNLSYGDAPGARKATPR